MREGAVDQLQVGEAVQTNIATAFWLPTDQAHPKEDCVFGGAAEAISSCFSPTFAAFAEDPLNFVEVLNCNSAQKSCLFI